MSNNDPTITSRKIWETLAFLLLGIAIPIIVSRIFRDNFYPALVITVIVLIGLFLAFMSSKVLKIIASIVTVIVASILIYYYPRSNLPKFEINIIGLPFQDEKAYYVTDAFIRTQGDLSAFNDFELAPPTIEIVPHYSGNEKFGNIALRVSGDSTETRNIPLWSDFDRTAQTQTVTLELADIVKISGIKKAIEEIDSSLMLGEKPYQEASLRFEIVRLSAPDKPYEPKMVLPIKNSPWIERVSVLSRNGVVVDYALENLGADATFYCRMNITKTLSDVNENDHVVWSGTYEIRSPKCGTFALKTGETYKITIPLNQETLGQDLARGRYIVQVYTFAERRDLIFKDGYNYENSNNLWVMANPGDIRAFVVCNDPGKSCTDSVTFPIEEGNVHVFPYSSMDQTQNGLAWFQIKTYIKDDGRTASRYILDYQIDPQNPSWSWAAFSMAFEKPIDLSNFKAIRMNFKFDDVNAPVMIKIFSTTNGVDAWKDIKLGDGVYGNNNTDYQTIVVPFSAFDSIDWTSVKAVDFVADTGSAPDANHHQFEVSEIEFIK